MNARAGLGLWVADCQIPGLVKDKNEQKCDTFYKKNKTECKGDRREASR